MEGVGAAGGVADAEVEDLDLEGMTLGVGAILGVEGLRLLLLPFLLEAMMGEEEMGVGAMGAGAVVVDAEVVVANPHNLLLLANGSGKSMAVIVVDSFGLASI